MELITSGLVTTVSDWKVSIGRKKVSRSEIVKFGRNSADQIELLEREIDLLGGGKEETMRNHRQI